MNLALVGEKLYLLNDLQEMRAEKVLDISFANFSISSYSMAAVGCNAAQGIVPVPENNSNNNNKTKKICGSSKRLSDTL